MQPPALRIARLVHPFPSFVNAAVVFGLSLLAGADLARSTLVAVGMLGIQFCIGVVNDLADEKLDATAKAWKPIPSGLVTRRAAALVAIAAGGGGLAAAAIVGPVPMLLVASVLGAGLAYDFVLKPTAWAWVCYAVAFSVLPVYAWFGATGTMPPRSELLLPLAAFAAPALQLSNGLTDIDTDRRGGIRTLATRLGQRRAIVVMGAVLALVHATAWLSLPLDSFATAAILVAATGLSIVGVCLSSAASTGLRQGGWTAQVMSVALLGLGWLAAVTV